MKSIHRLRSWRTPATPLYLPVECEADTETTAWVRIGDLTLMLRNDEGTPQVHAFTRYASAPSHTIKLEDGKVDVAPVPERSEIQPDPDKPVS